MSDRPTQPKSNPSSQNSSSSSINRANGTANGNNNTIANPNNNFINPQQQQSLRSSNNNSSSSNVSNNSAGNSTRPYTANTPMINRSTPPISTGNSNNDFISFLNGNSGSYVPSNNNSASSASPASNANALSRLETIRQYYMQLSNNLRLITQQLQGPDLTAARRQALLMEQARANAAMQEFTEKILKPISASKQQQQQAQMNAQAQVQMNAQQQAQVQAQINNQQTQNINSLQQQQQQQLQRPPAFNNQSSQMMNFHSRLPQPPNGINNMKSNNTINAGVNGYNQMNMQQQQQQMQQRPPNSNVNLYSQSGLGMIRPIITNGNNVNNRSLSVNYRPGQVPSNPLPVPQVTNMTTASPQRSYRPPSTVNVPLNNTGNAHFNNVNNMAMLNSTSPPQMMQLQPPGTPQSKASQQMIMNRQTYLMAAQQHQTSVAQQQQLFQQRLSLFSREREGTQSNVTAQNVPSNTQRIKGAPVLALPPAVSSQIAPRCVTTNSPQKGKPTVYPALSTNLTKYSYSSFPSSYAVGPKLQELAANFRLHLDEEAEGLFLRIADEFIDGLARKSFSFATHRLQTSVKKRSASTRKKSTPSTTEDADLVLSVEDLMLGLDELINYLPAGNGSIENCRPANKRARDNNAGGDGNNPSSNSNINTNHQHRLNMIKKHSSLYQYY